MPPAVTPPQYGQSGILPWVIPMLELNPLCGACLQGAVPEGDSAGIQGVLCDPENLDCASSRRWVGLQDLAALDGAEVGPQFVVQGPEVLGFIGPIPAIENVQYRATCSGD